MKGDILDILDNIFDSSLLCDHVMYWNSRWNATKDLCECGENIDYCLTRLCIVDNQEDEYIRWRNACYQTLNYPLKLWGKKNWKRHRHPTMKFLLKHHLDCVNDVATHHVSNVYFDLFGYDIELNEHEIKVAADYLALLDCFETYQFFVAKKLHEYNYISREEAYQVIDDVVNQYKSRTCRRLAIQSTDAKFKLCDLSSNDMTNYEKYVYRTRRY